MVTGPIPQMILQRMVLAGGRGRPSRDTAFRAEEVFSVFSRSHESVGRYRKAIATATDVLLIGTILLGCTIFLSAFREDFRAWHDPIQLQAVRAVHLFSLLVDVVVWSGVLGPLIGLLSFFQSNLTRFKRVILLILCLLPVLFTVPALVTGSAEDRRLMIQFGIIFSTPGWIENGPSVLTGQPLFHIIWRIMCKLHLASGDVPD